MRLPRILAYLIFFCSQILSAQTPPTALLSSLTIDEAVREAVNKNLTLLATRFDVPIARAQVITAGLRPNPVLSIYGDLLNLIPPKYNDENTAGPPEFGLRLDYLFERGGKRQLRLEVARAAQTVTEFLVLDSVRQLVLSVQTAFVEVLQATADLALAMENLKTFEEIVRINESKLKAGDIAEVEVIRTQVALLQFENTVRQVELQLQTSRVQLQILLGRRKSEVMAQPSGEMRRDAILPSLELLRQQAIAQRPDLLAQQRDRARSLFDVRLQLANAKIDYTIGSEYRRQQGLAGTGNSLGFFFQTNLPVFNRNQGEIERARQQQAQADARIRAMDALIENDVEVAYLKYASALKTIERIEGSLFAKVRDVRQITEFSYRRGEANFLELLDAQRAYNETMQAYNAARADLAESLYGMDAAIAAPFNQEKKP